MASYGRSGYRPVAGGEHAARKIRQCGSIAEWFCGAVLSANRFTIMVLMQDSSRTQANLGFLIGPRRGVVGDVHGFGLSWKPTANLAGRPVRLSAARSSTPVLTSTDQFPMRGHCPAGNVEGI
ncbi:hypothetical protein [Paractinoplanes globisporus]|uniref:Uncharacterized protein n=1 Tax=Paractinoplanes globisporus TaxID=113565 RepID=A0ABW6WME1_9ACTN|nr:hypothetical protein [Actinoplanes globisporus]